ncbi:hypothetical protein FMM05_02030 [Flavobacterium zepuense]|uniref:Uncharacterized protein n=1 Tax=Flavobacterium zepuense TaxID=2593302 RepID=A0A552VAQ8_9FLAO|nr:hypothetical protein [Flavobacterium zepuense]TRW27440.1 hypothetical protein FMM05_02030 [Flavobacterium zepuense]
MMKLLPYILFLISLTALAQENQSINWDEATINNKLTLTISKRDFEAVYKKDYIVRSPTDDETCGTADEANVKMLYYKGVVFELDNNMLNFRRVVFDKKTTNFFTLKGIRYDQHTTIEAFRKIFPDSKKIREIETRPDGTYSILVVSETQADGEWEFHFTAGNLSSIQYSFSCE